MLEAHPEGGDPAWLEPLPDTDYKQRLTVLGSVALVLACSRIGLRGRAVAAAWQ